jgi:predicted secreted hydrolase
MSASRFLPIVIALAFLASASSADSQGFAGLGSDAAGFTVPQRGTTLVFPHDHGAHPDFRIEWWYVTANLVADDGRRFGAQWTLFRSALSPEPKRGWSDPQIWIGHAAITSSDRQYVAERLGRGGVGQAGVVAEPFEAWIDDWQMKAIGIGERDQLNRLDLNANGADFSYRLKLLAKQAPVLQGDRGYSLKSESGQASYYYSQPFYEAQGTLVLDGARIAVRGRAWLDREWSSQPLAADQTGWDWFSLHLATGEKVMAFRLRDGGSGFNSASWITAEGEATPLSGRDIVLEPLRTATLNGRSIPVSWRVRVPSRGLDVKTEPLNERAWMATSTPYWEGPISFEGSVNGEGYLEMTGY